MKKTVFLLFLLLPFGYLLAQPPVPASHPFTAIAQPVNDEQLVDDNVTGNQNDWANVQLGNDNYLWLTVPGNKNGKVKQSTSYQKGNRNYAEVLQPGDKNRFEIEQKNELGVGTNYRNKTYIRQMGDENEAIVTQRIKNNDIPGVTNGKLVAKTLQTGDGNWSNQKQVGMKNRAYVVQRGDNGKAKQVQGDSYMLNGEKAYYNSALIKQTSDADEADAYQYQHGFNNDAYIKQSTEDSEAYQVQFNDAGAKDNAWNDNVARIYQRDEGTGNSDENNAYQVQSFNKSVGADIGNMATIIQKGSGNDAWQVQLGAKNTARTRQIGNNNTGEVVQIQTGGTLPIDPADLPFSLPASIAVQL